MSEPTPPPPSVADQIIDMINVILTAGFGAALYVGAVLLLFWVIVVIGKRRE